MSRPHIILISFVLAALVLSTDINAREEHPTHYTIGTGSVGATFYPLARALCSRVNQQDLGFTCEAVSTPGSMHNLQALISGEHDFALSQLPLQYQAYRGLKPFRSRHEVITTVAPLHQEIFILAVNPNSGIDKLSDIKSKRVNIGNEGSGSRIIIEQLFDYKGWELSEFEIHSKKSQDLPGLLCNGEIDAALYSTGHPNALYKKMISQCGVQLIDLWDKDIASFVAEKWQFVPAAIPANSYQDVPIDKIGFGVQVVLSASRDLPDSHVYQIVRTLVEDKNRLASQLLVFKTIDAKSYPMRHIAPYHGGANRYYREE